MRQYVELFLTCENSAEADRIAQALLDKHLIVCAKQVPVTMAYWWQGNIERGTETLLVMESAADLFDEIEAEVGKIHSYETFVLEALPFLKVSSKATKWLEDNLKMVSDSKDNQESGIVDRRSGRR